VRDAAIAIANPVDGDTVSMTNHGWRFSIEATRRALGFDTPHVVNDFSALAMALPYLADDQRRQVGGGRARPDSPIGVLGAGTGLGVSALVRAGDTWVPLSGEGGHVSFERLAAGPGAAMIHAALAARDGEDPTALGTADIVAHALAGDVRCVATIDCFCGMLGTLAGNLALTLGATGASALRRTRFDFATPSCGPSAAL
jgi:glucokinase